MKVEKAHVEAVWRFLYEGLKAHYEEGKPFYQALDMPPIDYTALTDLARYMQEPLGKGIAGDSFLLDAVHRMECFIRCPAFYECPLDVCDGVVWCKDFNLGGSHGMGIRRGMTREEHKRAILERQKKK